MKLILITGAPASGKSSIAKAVSEMIQVSYISKDCFKIQLFEKYGFTSHKEKKRLSILGEDIMYDHILNSIRNNEDIIVDNNFKNFDRIRNIIKMANVHVKVICIYCEADYNILAYRYNERISSGVRHKALYTLNQYPIIKGISEFHPYISKDDVERIQEEVSECYYGDRILKINTDHIGDDFCAICQKIVSFINELDDEKNETMARKNKVLL